MGNNIITIEKSTGQAVFTCRSEHLEKINQTARESGWEVEVKALSLEDIYKLVVTQNNVSKPAVLEEIK